MFRYVHQTLLGQSEKATTIMILVKHSSIGLPDLNLGDAEVGVRVVVFVV